VDVVYFNLQIGQNIRGHSLSEILASFFAGIYFNEKIGQVSNTPTEDFLVPDVIHSTRKDLGVKILMVV
jgi:hypothetical protein